MKQWRLNILIELYDFPSGAIIYTVEPRSPRLVPILRIVGSSTDEISWKHFDALIKAGDLVEVRRHVTTEYPLKGFTFFDYKISESGKAALQALPNFDKRVARQRAVTV